MTTQVWVEAFSGDGAPLGTFTDIVDSTDYDPVKSARIAGYEYCQACNVYDADPMSANYAVPIAVVGRTIKVH